LKEVNDLSRQVIQKALKEKRKSFTCPFKTTSPATFLTKKIEGKKPLQLFQGWDPH
jgi:hypothetical protein